MTRPVLSTLLCGCILLSAACESSEERAEEHFQEGVALLEAGDVDRALIEFRNVFRLEGTHREARRLYAQAEIERGNLRSGYGQYLRLVEQYPDDVEARRELTRLALAGGQWEEVEKHSPFVIEADASDAVGRLADLGLRYRTAVEQEDATALAQIADEARALREELPDDPMIPELMADYYVREGRREEALDEVARALELTEQPRRLYAMRLALLQEMGDLDAVESTLTEMVELFPDDPAVPATLLRWYLAQEELEKAEAFLRDRAQGGGAPENIDLVRFLTEYRSKEMAIEELDRLVAQDPENAVQYRAVRAGLAFETGQREQAIAELQSMIDAAEEDSEQIRNVKVALARMLEQTGNSVGARALTEDVLAADPGHAEALKMRAGWLIEADETDEAIITLRGALEQNPRDPSLMTLMAQAYERAGNRALMAEMLSLAVEVSNRAPAETIRYARYLVSQENADVAERAVVDSLRMNPDNQELLQFLGLLYADQQDWSRADQVADSLAALGGEDAKAAANALRARVLVGRGSNEEAVNFLEQLVESGEAGIDAQVGVVRGHVASGDLETAMNYVDGLLEENPSEPTLRSVKASLLEAMGRREEAEEMLAEVAQDHPDAELVWRALYITQQRAGKAEAASATLDRALEANPGSRELLWIKASELQRLGDLEGALEIYARMYEENSSDPIIANNYASLLTTLRNDEEAIERAYAVARRLQGLDVPAFQDTYGWIAYLRGEYDAAVEHLEPAAAAVTDDPSIQYHLAVAYEAVGRIEEAKEALQRALDLADQGIALPQLEEARQKLAELQSVGE